MPETAPAETEQEDDTQDPLASRKVRMVLAGAGHAVSVFAGRHGVTDEDVQALFIACGNRLNEAYTLIHGGSLPNGRPVKGLLATELALARIEQRLDALFDLMAAKGPATTSPRKPAAAKPKKGVR